MTSTISTQPSGAESIGVRARSRWRPAGGGRQHHVGQLALDLVPGPCLHPAVGVGPHVGWRHVVLEVAESLVHDLAPGVRGVDVEQARPDLEVTVGRPDVERSDPVVVHRAGVPDGRHVHADVGPQRGDRRVGPVAHVGVHLDPAGWLKTWFSAARTPRAIALRLGVGGGQGQRSRTAGSSTWMTRAPVDQVADLLGDRLCHRPEQAIVVDAGRRKLQFTMVTGPVSMPLTGLSVASWAIRHSATVIGSLMVGGAARIGGRHRLPYEDTHPAVVVW